MKLPRIGTSVEVMNNGQVQHTGHVIGYCATEANDGLAMDTCLVVKLDRGFWSLDKLTYVSALLVHTDHVRERLLGVTVDEHLRERHGGAQ